MNGGLKIRPLERGTLDNYAIKGIDWEYNNITKDYTIDCNYGCATFNSITGHCFVIIPGYLTFDFSVESVFWGLTKVNWLLLYGVYPVHPVRDKPRITGIARDQIHIMNIDREYLK